MSLFKFHTACDMSEDGRHLIEVAGEIEDLQGAWSARTLVCEEDVAEAAHRLGALTCFSLVAAIRGRLEGFGGGGPGVVAAWCASCCMKIPIFFMSRSNRDWHGCPQCLKDGVLRFLPL